MLPGESFVSWVGRFARLQCGMTAKAFVSLMGVPLHDVVRTKKNAVRRMHELSGIPAERLVQGGYIQLANRYYGHRGQEFHSEFVAGNRVSFCPRCILTDTTDCQQSMGMPVGRINWSFTPIRTCPVHSIPLVREREDGRGKLLLDLVTHIPTDVQLNEMASAAVPRSVSALQSYLEARLEGGLGSGWLDSQMIDLASRATEMLGACIEFGPSVKLPGLTQSDWDLAGRVGFEFTSRGPEGIQQGLEAIQSNASCSRIQAGPRGVFGFLYEWVQFKKNRKPIGPFRDVFREHILETMPIPAGTELFGEPVARRRRHSVASLSRKFGVSHRTVRNALVVADLLPADYDPKRDFGVMDVAPAENLLKRMRRSIPVLEVPEYLGCKRGQVAQLLEVGFLKPIAGRRDGRRSVSQGIDGEDLDAFVRQLRSFGQAVSEPSEGMRGIVDTAESFKVPTVKVVELLLQRSLSKVELLDEELRFQSVFVNEFEVGRKLGCRVGNIGISVTKAARTLGLSAYSVGALLRTPSGETDPYLFICGQTRHMGQMRDLVDPVSVKRFQASFQKISAIAERMKVTVPAARKSLLDKGILPVWDPQAIGVELYRTSDL